MEKLVTVYANISIAEDIREVLDSLGIKAFTQWPRLVGVGPVTGPRLDSHVWPGANTCFQVVVDETMAGRLMDALQEMRDSPVGTRSGLFAFTSPVERTLK